MRIVSPQVSYAIEVTIDEICKSQGWDSLEFRILNASKEGTRRGDGPKFPKIGNLDVLEAVQKSDHWNSTKPKSKSGKLIGRGIASGYWMNGGGKSSVTLSIIPPELSLALIAPSHEAGFPIRIAVAIVSGAFVFLVKSQRKVGNIL